MLKDKKILYSIPLLIGEVEGVNNEVIIENALKNNEKKIMKSKLDTGFEDSNPNLTDRSKVSKNGDYLVKKGPFQMHLSIILGL